jgi:charged multivesicular body protein 4A/B
MWSLFGVGGAAANKKKQDTAKNSIVKLREQVNMLEKKEAHLQKQIDELTATAKRNAGANKKGTSPSITQYLRFKVDLDSCVGSVTAEEDA